VAGSLLRIKNTQTASSVFLLNLEALTSSMRRKVWRKVLMLYCILPLMKAMS
jgi:hypothetical protein